MVARQWRWPRIYPRSERWPRWIRTLEAPPKLKVCVPRRNAASCCVVARYVVCLLKFPSGFRSAISVSVSNADLRNRILGTNSEKIILQCIHLSKLRWLGSVICLANMPRFPSLQWSGKSYMHVNRWRDSVKSENVQQTYAKYRPQVFVFWVRNTHQPVGWRQWGIWQRVVNGDNLGVSFCRTRIIQIVDLCS